jgi:condensin complex subunit 1
MPHFPNQGLEHTQLGDEILREIAGKNFSSADEKAASEGPRSIARFPAKFAELSQRSILKLSLLLNQLDSEVSEHPLPHSAAAQWLL